MKEVDTIMIGFEEIITETVETMTETVIETETIAKGMNGVLVVVETITKEMTMAPKVETITIRMIGALVVAETILQMVLGDPVVVDTILKRKTILKGMIGALVVGIILKRKTEVGVTITQVGLIRK